MYNVAGLYVLYVIVLSLFFMLPLLLTLCLCLSHGFCLYVFFSLFSLPHIYVHLFLSLSCLLSVSYFLLQCLCVCVCDQGIHKAITCAHTQPSADEELIYIWGRNSSLVVSGLAVHSVAGLILLWGNFPVKGSFPLELTWVQTPFPPKLIWMRV